jgi:hypothetical protein
MIGANFRHPVKVSPDERRAKLGLGWRGNTGRSSGADESKTRSKRE